MTSIIQCYETERDSLRLSLSKNLINYAEGKTKPSFYFFFRKWYPKIVWHKEPAEDYAAKVVRQKVLERYAINLITKNTNFLYVCGVNFIKFGISWDFFCHSK